MGSKSLPLGGYAKDAVEVEGYVRGFGRRRPDVAVTLLRFTNFIGPRIETVMIRYFSLPVVFNVGGDGVLMLSQTIRRADRVPLPVPVAAVGPVSQLVRGVRLVDFSPEQMRS